jgi:hypothetical protein
MALGTVRLREDGIEAPRDMTGHILPEYSHPRSSWKCRRIFGGPLEWFRCNTASALGTQQRKRRRLDCVSADRTSRRGKACDRGMSFEAISRSAGSFFVLSRGGTLTTGSCSLAPVSNQCFIPFGDPSLTLVKNRTDKLLRQLARICFEWVMMARHNQGRQVVGRK